MSIISSTSDLPLKYQKLAAEYAKLRAQIPVLKTAVIDERNERDSLQDKLREDEQKNRKLESEIESLAFRNDQLTKRVEFLQEKLEEATNPNIKKKKGKMTKSQSYFAVGNGQTNSIVAEELDRKIRENTDLHTQIFELESTHERELSGVMEKMSVLEKENYNLNQTVACIKSENESVFCELCREKDKLFNRIKSLESQLASNSLINRSLNMQNVSSPGASNYSTNNTNSVLSSPVENNSNNNNEFEMSLEMRSELFEETKRLIEQILTGLCGIFCGLQQRAQYYPKDTTMEEITDTQKLMINCLLIGKETLELVISKANKLFNECQKGNREEIVSSFQEFLTSYSNLCHLCDSDLLESLTKSTTEENNVSWCSESLSAANVKWKDEFVTFSNCLMESAKEFSVVRCKDSHAIIVCVIHVVDNLTKSASDLSCVFDGKLVPEHATPTVTKRLRVVNECLSASISSFAKNLSYFRNSLSMKREPMEKFICWTKQMQSGNPFQSELQEEEIDVECETGVNIEECTIQLRKVVDKGQITALEKEICENRDKICKLQEEKDKLKIEVQLVKGKNEKDGDFNNLEVDANTLDSFYCDRMRQLRDDLHEAHGKAVYFKEECEALISLVVERHLCNKQLKYDLQQSMDKIQKLNDELETTRDNYEQQMCSLTEHMAQMDETVLKQSEQITMIQAQAKNGSTKRKFF